MLRLCILVGTVVFGYGFWALGEALGFDFFGSFLLSGLGSVIGVVVSWKVYQRYLD